MRPDEIESLSFSIIDDQAGQDTAQQLGLTMAQYTIARRMVHTTGDFDYFTNARFHANSVAAGIKAIKDGRPVIADTRMLAAGLTRLPQGVEVVVKVDEPETWTLAQEKGVTRSLIGMQRAARIMDGAIVAIGNAPTALLEVIRLVEKGEANPALIVGIPVGFVKAAESKDDLAVLDRCFITSLGAKGGSAVAATVVNALAIMAGEV